MNTQTTVETLPHGQQGIFVLIRMCIVRGIADDTVSDTVMIIKGLARVADLVRSPDSSCARLS